MTPADFSLAYTAKFPATVSWLARRGCKEPEEIAQAAWARAWEKREQWGGTSPFINWVLTIAWNILRSRCRHPWESLEQDILHSADLVSLITAHQILARCDMRAARCLRERYLEDREFEEIGHGGRPSGVHMVRRSLEKARYASAPVRGRSLGH